MSQEYSRRDFLAFSLLAGVGAFVHFKEGEPDTPLDIVPEQDVTYSVPPFGNSLEEIMGDGVNPGGGYRFLQPTVNVNYAPDGGHHLGVDFNWGDIDEDCGTPLRLIMNGVCVFAGECSYHRDLGKIAIFCHRLSDGSLIYTRYAHLNSFSVTAGTNYRVGEIVATMGKSGWENGFCHLHLDILTRAGFADHILADPWWYPHTAPVRYLRRYFLDPVEVISPRLRKEKNGT
jgi:murein DD-endopeptidase MepM/ murein hydrolase activator NlpD